MGDRAQWSRAVCAGPGRVTGLPHCAAGLPTGRSWSPGGVCAAMKIMKKAHLIIFWCCIAMRGIASLEIQHDFEKHAEVSIASDARGRRDVIEEEKFFNINSEIRNENSHPTPWMPGPLPPDEDPTTKISLTNTEVKEVLPLYQTTERATDKPTGRGARASNENWIKLPLPDREDQRDDILTPPHPSGDLINSRMPRVNFVTQNKQLEASESRNDKESIQRATRTDDIRTEFVRPGEDDRKLYKPVYPRQAVYYPEESRRHYYDDRFYPADDLYRRDPYFDLYDRRRFPGYGPRIDRYDDTYDNYVPRKPKRIIYYAHLPEVMRTPPNVDLRTRFGDPYRRFDDDYYARNGRYDYRFRNRYPYAPLRKEERNYRDLAGAGTVVKDKKVDEKVTPTPVLPQKDEKFKANSVNNHRNVNKNFINSHQYHEGLDSYNNDQLTHKNFQDVLRPDDGYLRFDEPLFQGTVEDPYQRKY